MTDQELRALVRDAVARHLGPRTAGPAAVAAPRVSTAAHPSHAIYLTLVNTGEACVIEPSVPCNHCNYCKSHGH
jgi:hypothetical protein